MALPSFTPPPTVPNPSQPEGDFNTNNQNYLNWMAIYAGEQNAWTAALPVEVNDQIQAAIEAYDPTGNYSADQVDALLAARAKDAEDLALLYATAF